MKRLTNKLSLLAKSIGVIALMVFLAPHAFAANGGLSTAMQIYDTNSNGKIDQIVVSIVNGGGKTGHAYSTAGWYVTDNGNPVTVSSVYLNGSATANPQIYFVSLNENDPDLTVDTANPDLEVSYTQQGLGYGTEYDSGTAEITTISATHGLDDFAAPTPVSATFYDHTVVDGEIDLIKIYWSETLVPINDSRTEWTLTSASDFSNIVEGVVICNFGGLATNECDYNFSTSTVKTDVGDLNLVYAPAVNGIMDADTNTAPSHAFNSGSVPVLTDGAAPFPKTAEFFDGNGDGKLDRITSTWSEPLSAVTNGSSDWAISSVADFADLTEGTVECNNGGATTDECDYNFTTSTVKTDVGDLNLGYTAGTSVKDSANNPTISLVLNSASTPALDDKAAPVIKDFTYKDNDALPDGKIDQLMLIFSEAVGGNSVMSHNDLIFTNVGDFTGAVIGTDSSDLIGGPMTFYPLDLATEATAVDTHDDSGHLAISTKSNFYLEDMAGNGNPTLGPQTQATFTDGAPPTIKELKYEDINNDGYTDRFVATFTETALASSFMSANNFSFADDGNFDGALFGSSTNDFITSDTTTATIPLGTPATVQDTSEDSGTIAINNDHDAFFDLLDSAGNHNNAPLLGGPMSFITYTDGAPPFPKTATFLDADHDGHLDSVTVKWTEAINSVPDGVPEWAISSASDFAGLAEGTVKCNSGTAGQDECKYNFTTTTVKTDVGDLTLAYTAGTVSDVSNSAVSRTFTSASTPAFTDGAAPVFVSAKADSDTNVNIIMSEPVSSVTFGDSGSWTATGITSSATTLKPDNTIDLTVASLGDVVFTAPDFAFSTGPGGIITDAATNATTSFSGKFIADGQPPVVSAGELTADESACTGAGGTVCRIGDVITFSWDNSVGTGDGNADVASVTADLSSFGGPGDQLLYDNGMYGDNTSGDQIYKYAYTVVADDDDSAANTFIVTATDTSDNPAVSPASTDTAPIDDIPPIIATPGVLTIATDANSNSTAEIGDSVSYTNLVLGGSADGDTIGLDLSALTGDAAATSGGSPYAVLAGILNNNIYFTESATDNAGNITTGFVNPIDVDNATGSGFNSASIAPNLKLTGATTFTTVSFASALDLPVNGKIVIIFPAGFSIAGITDVSNLTGLDGTFAIGIAGQTVTLTRNGDGSILSAGSTASFHLNSTVNPITAGTTGTFSLITKTSADVALSSLTTLPGAAIVAPTPLPTVSNPPSGGGGGGGGGGGSYIGNLAKKSTTPTPTTGNTGEGLHGSAGTAPTFPDTAGHWAQSYINKIAELGIVDGKTPTEFAPDDDISRAELLKIAVNAFKIALPDAVTEKPLPDIETADWFAPYVKSAFDNGIIYGFETGLEPNTSASRAMAVTILAKAAGFTDVNQNFADKYSSHPDWTFAHFPDVPMDVYYAPYVAYLFDKGIIGGYEDGTFGPGNPITRAEIAKIVVNLLDFLGQ